MHVEHTKIILPDNARFLVLIELVAGELPYQWRVQQDCYCSWQRPDGRDEGEVHAKSLIAAEELAKFLEIPVQHFTIGGQDPFI